MRDASPAPDVRADSPNLGLPNGRPLKIMERVIVTDKDRAMWAREARRIENKIAHKRRTIALAEEEIPALDAEHQRLLDRIAADYAEENG